MTESQRPAGDRTEPYLESLDSATATRVVALEWARYLVDAFGTTGAVRALQYYEDVGWISPAVRRAMVDHVRSRSPEDVDDDPGGDPEELDSFDGTPFEEHARSLEYVAAVADDSLAAELRSLRLPSTAGASVREESGTTTDATDPAGPDAATDADSIAPGGESTAAEGGSAAPAGQDAPTESSGQDATAEPSEQDATAESAAERVGVAGSPADAATFHRLSDGGDRSRCGMLDADSETTPDVSETLPRDEAEEAGLSLCTHCRDSSGE